ncbi:hypothetical protein [Methylobacterium nodulans]|uniref:Glutamine amidotransferase n=1 Tax=Methylobacterium nodulans (strain LMG 21967 / CNCM I-2342 / ORS 2060) TaxID=460265 RepID=B8IN08_METNO|nr:hypothetical protein [Methylobacterium nodulans]ACL62124.1 conserved hypothetical protein [Methylobacterium nodulans ORS 2060]
MFTLEIDGTPIAVIRASEARARELLDVEGFKDDLRTMTSEGRPLWSGNAAQLKLRPSTEEEIETFDDAMEEDEEFEHEPDDSGTGAAANSADTEDDEPEDVDILFLVDIDDEAEH